MPDAEERLRSMVDRLVYATPDVEQSVHDLAERLGVVPFFIDWGVSAHPAPQSAVGLTLVGLRAEHGAAHDVSAMLHFIGVGMEVRQATTAAFMATLDGPNGRVELR